MKNHLTINSLVSVILLFIAVSACKIMTPVTVEFPKPAPSKIPDNIQSLLIINRTPEMVYSDNQKDSLQVTFYRQSFNYDTTIYDKTVADTTLHAIGELLFESRRFDFVIPEERFMNDDRNNLAPSQMAWEQVDSLCRKYKTDAVLAMDYYYNYVSAKLTRHSISGSFNQGQGWYYRARIKILYNVLFKIYDPKERSVVASQLLKDTLLWDREGFSLREVFSELTPVKQALTETGIEIALKLAEKIAPTWEPERRKYFSGQNRELRNISTYVENNDWVSAMDKWEDFYSNHSSKAVRSKAAYNLALGYEMNGDMNQAIKWGLKSFDDFYRKETYNYLLLLKSKQQKK